MNQAHLTTAEYKRMERGIIEHVSKFSRYSMKVKDQNRENIILLVSVVEASDEEPEELGKKYLLLTDNNFTPVLITTQLFFYIHRHVSSSILDYSLADRKN